MAHTAQLLDSAEDGSPLDLAVAGDTINDFRVNGEQQVQVAAGVRASAVTPINRENFADRVTLGIIHAPSASPSAAKLGVVSRIAAIRAKMATATILAIVFEDKTLHLLKPALSTYDLHAQGVAVFATYTFVVASMVDATEEP